MSIVRKFKKNGLQVVEVAKIKTNQEPVASAVEKSTPRGKSSTTTEVYKKFIQKYQAEGDYKQVAFYTEALKRMEDIMNGTPEPSVSDSGQITGDIVEPKTISKDIVYLAGPNYYITHNNGAVYVSRLSVAGSKKSYSVYRLC